MHALVCSHWDLCLAWAARMLWVWTLVWAYTCNAQGEGRCAGSRVWHEECWYSGGSVCVPGPRWGRPQGAGRAGVQSALRGCGGCGQVIYLCLDYIEKASTADTDMDTDTDTYTHHAAHAGAHTPSHILPAARLRGCPPPRPRSASSSSASATVCILAAPLPAGRHPCLHRDHIDARWG